MYVPSDSFGGLSPEKKASQALETLLTFTAAKIVLAQLEGSGRGALGAYNQEGYAVLSRQLQEVSLRDPHAWLDDLVRKDKGIALRLMEVRSAYASSDFEWDQLQRLAVKGIQDSNLALMRKAAAASLQATAAQAEAPVGAAATSEAATAGSAASADAVVAGSAVEQAAGGSDLQALEQQQQQQQQSQVQSAQEGQQGQAAATAADSTTSAAAAAATASDAGGKQQPLGTADASTSAAAAAAPPGTEIQQQQQQQQLPPDEQQA